MYNDTIVIIGLLGVALTWWLGIRINEEIQRRAQLRQEELEKLKRAERIKWLTNRS